MNKYILWTEESNNTWKTQYKNLTFRALQRPIAYHINIKRRNGYPSHAIYWVLQKLFMCDGVEQWEDVEHDGIGGFPVVGHSRKHLARWMRQHIKNNTNG